MNRVDFMNQLEGLLQSISSTEREEAVQYYNDYFDDAGEENEQEVIEALGNPARVAENIKRDLANNGYGEGFAQKVKASDRALMEYGKSVPEDSDNSQDADETLTTGQSDNGTAGNSGQTVMKSASEGISDGRQTAEYGSDRQNSTWQSQQAGNMSSGHNGQSVNASAAYDRTITGYSREGQSTSAGYDREGQSTSAGYDGEGQSTSAGYSPEGQSTSSGYNQDRQNASGGYGQGSRDSSGTYGSRSNPFEDYGTDNQYTSGTGSSGTWDRQSSGYAPEKHKKGDGMPVWAIAMLVTVLIIASPVLGAVALGALGIIVGFLGGWFGMIFGFGVTSIVLLIVMLVLVVVGIICFFASPWVGIALVGGGLICGSLGLLFLMLTVAMAGIATPAICRGIAFVFRGFKRKRVLAN